MGDLAAILMIWLIGIPVAAIGLVLLIHGLCHVRSWRGWVRALAGVLIVVGACGFFGAGLSACGGLDRLGSFEWPVGYASDVVRTANGIYVVPHWPSGRVQLYDENRRFLRGWRVAASGGIFVVRASPGETIDVYTARGEHHFVYDLDGKLISQTKYDIRAVPRLIEAPPESFSMMIPTLWILWPLTHPIYAWLCIMLGLVMLNGDARAKLRSRKNARSDNQLPVDV